MKLTATILLLVVLLAIAYLSVDKYKFYEILDCTSNVEAQCLGFLLGFE